MNIRLLALLRRTFVLGALVFGASSSAGVAQIPTLLGAIKNAATNPVTVSVSGNTATANIALPGGIGADFTVSFDSAQNLTADNLGISAQLVDVNAADLIARLPDSLLTSVPSAFPMLITVEPSGGFAFTNSYVVNIHTHNLTYVPGSTFRIFKAPLHGNFADITEDVNQGSVNTRGREGGFSQFLIVADLRPNASVAVNKFNALSTRIANTAMSPALQAQLNATLAQARTAFNANDYAGAIASIDTFRSQVQAQAGTGLANVWRATRDVDNAEGVLDGMAATLRFTLTRLRDFGQ
jgi:hypothetical protein